MLSLRPRRRPRLRPAFPPQNQRLDTLTSGPVAPRFLLPFSPGAIEIRFDMISAPRAFGALLLTATLAACRSGSAATPNTAPEVLIPPIPRSEAAIAKAREDSAQKPYVEADIRFMSGMISHHAQAIAMSKLAPSRGASASVMRLTERIINAQTDEIRLMAVWLTDRNQPVPKASPTGMRMVMGGVEHDHLMPGMLSPEQMKQLEQARGAEFDRLFLTFMIQHHRGAVAMVQELFGSYGAGVDETVFKFASDVNVDQATEIARMQTMLAALTP
jgi:uncharacterized protein (DUF305 family)